jgi:hypothetical protein
MVYIRYLKLYLKLADSNFEMQFLLWNTAVYGEVGGSAWYLDIL